MYAARWAAWPYNSANVLPALEKHMKKSLLHAIVYAIVICLVTGLAFAQDAGTAASGDLSSAHFALVGRALSVFAIAMVVAMTSISALARRRS